MGWSQNPAVNGRPAQQIVGVGGLEWESVSLGGRHQTRSSSHSLPKH